MVPYVSLGAAYIRNASKWPNINAQAKETLRGPVRTQKSAFRFSVLFQGKLGTDVRKVD